MTAQSRIQNAQPPAPHAVRRDESLDIAKGFGIVLVVLGHVLDGLIAARYFPINAQWPMLTVYVIYLFHMPLFFVVSGHLASGKHRPAGQTIARLLPTIVYPYFLWSVLEGLMLVGLGQYTTSHTSITALYKILWIPLVPYWFLYALFFAHLGYLVVRRWPHWVQMAIAGVVFVTPLFFLTAINQFDLEIVLQVVRGFLYFILGVVSVVQVKQLGKWAAVIATVLFAVLSVAIYGSQVSGSYSAFTVLPAAVAGIVATLAWARVLAAGRASIWMGLSRGLAFLGRYSMSIYVMHIFFTAGVRIALRRLAMHPSVWSTVVEITAATVVGTLLPLGINWVVSRLNLDRWFGLQHMEASTS